MPGFVSTLEKLPQVTQIIISVAIMLFFGFLLTRFTKLLKLPNVTAYILAGILIGPYCLNLIPSNVISGTDFISDIALAFIAFSVGEFFKFSTLKRSGYKTIIITIFEALFSSILVFIVMFFILQLDLSFSIILSALAAATAPASIVMTIRQTKSKGPFVDSLLQVIALDNIVSLLAFSVAISIALSSISGDALSFGVIAIPLLKNLGAVAIGIMLGFVLKFILTDKRTTDNRLIIVICVLFLFCGICSVLDVSPLLGCMAIGTVYINFAKDEKLFLQVNYFSPPLLLLFFVRSGLNFNFSALFTTSTVIGSIPLIVIGLIYFIVRMIGKFSGSYVGGITAKADKKTRNFLGLGLVPQAGVAIGLAVLAARTIGGEAGESIHTVILASSILYEIIGPVCAKFSLFLTKSYSDKIEDVAPVKETNADGTKKSDVDILIERIQTIHKEVVSENKQISAEEEAFIEASEDELEAYYNDLINKKRRRK